jgi:hypothetical protein
VLHTLTHRQPCWSSGGRDPERGSFLWASATGTLPSELFILPSKLLQMSWKLSGSLNHVMSSPAIPFRFQPCSHLSWRVSIHPICLPSCKFNQASQADGVLRGPLGRRPNGGVGGCTNQARYISLHPHVSQKKNCACIASCRYHMQNMRSAD